MIISLYKQIQLNLFLNWLLNCCWRGTNLTHVMLPYSTSILPLGRGIIVYYVTRRGARKQFLIWIGRQTIVGLNVDCLTLFSSLRSCHLQRVLKMHPDPVSWPWHLLYPHSNKASVFKSISIQLLINLRNNWYVWQPCPRPRPSNL